MVFRGPLGAGCSTTAQFLSGTELNSQTTMKESLKLQTSKLLEIDKKIKSEYQKIYTYKEDAGARISKNLGPYKKDWIDPNTDVRIEAVEQKIKRVSSKLKIYLNRREILKTLQRFLNSDSFNKKNINDLDKKAFGADPFCYISFTTIISKLALEAYLNYGGKKKLDVYFEGKIKNSKNVEVKNTYKDLKRFIKRKYKISEELKATYIASNKFIKNRVYQVALHTELLSSAKKLQRTLLITNFQNFIKAIMIL